MATQVIDKLIVELGLDPKNFTKGSKEAAAAIIDTEKKTTTASNNMVAGLRRVTAEFVSLFIAIRSIKDVVGVFADLNQGTRQLGIDSRNLGESAAALKNLGNIAEILGGKAEDAQATWNGLEKAIFNVQHGLGWSDQLTEFGRIGVDTGVTAGKARPAYDVLRETTAALEQQYPDRSKRYQETQVLGLQGGIAQLVAGGLKDFDRQYRQQLSISQVTPGQTNAAQQVSESWNVLKQRVEAELRKILTAIEPALNKLFRGIGDFIAEHSKDITQGLQVLFAWASGDGPQLLVNGLIAATKALWDFVGTAVKAVDFWKHPVSSNFKAFSGLGELAHYANDRTGIAQEEYAAETKFGIPHGTLSNDLLPKHSLPGVGTQIAERLARAHAAAGGDKGDPDWSAAIDAVRADFSMANSDPTAAQAAQGASPSPRAQATIASKPTAFNQTSGSTSVGIDTMNVYTQATDANGIARDIGGALNRKLTASLVDGALS